MMESRSAATTRSGDRIDGASASESNRCRSIHRTGRKG
jgi:hypothetical protein